MDPTNSFVSVGAPGVFVKVLHDSLTNDYTTASGTSLATPMVSAIIGLMLSIYPDLTQEIATEILINTADKVGQFNYDGNGWNQRFGYGRVNAYKSLKYLLEHYGGTLVQDIFIPPGESWTFYSGSVISLNGYSIISTGGSITVQNGATINGLAAYLKQGATLKGYCGSIQSGLNDASSGQTVEILSGTYTENITNDNYNVAVVGAGTNSTTINGTVTFSSADYSSLKDVAVNGKISVNNSSSVVIDNVKANNSNCYIDAYGSSVTIDGFVSEVTQTRGLYAHNSSSSYVDDSSFRNKYDGQHYEDTSYGENIVVVFCQNQTYDIVAFNNAYVENYWCSYSSPSEGSTVYGNVSWYTWNFCGMYKSVSDAGKTLLLKTNEEDSGYEEFKSIMAYCKAVRDKIRNEMKEGKKDAVENYTLELLESVSRFKNFINKNSGSKYSSVVLGHISAIYGMLRLDEELLSYVNDIALKKELDHLRPYSLNSILTLHIRRGEYQKGLELSEQLIKEYPKHPLAVEWLYGQGLTYKYKMNELERAEEIFKEVIQKYPEHGTAISAREQLGIGEKNIPKEQTVLTSAGVEFTIQNYPNPFNPTTKIKYSIPEAGLVVLKVYDMLGKEIGTLVNDKKQSGHYETTFNGSSLPSGIYFYSINYNNQILSGKMILLK